MTLFFVVYFLTKCFSGLELPCRNWTALLNHGQCVGCQLPKPSSGLRGWQCPRGCRSSDGTTRFHDAPSVCSPTLLRHTRAARDGCRGLSPQPRHI
ncbi:hypothetical protein F2P79_012505 [Pimephales promelas]|nr:hypothetical protein F2P79_012505 [Pimephales promelas]